MSDWADGHLTTGQVFRKSEPMQWFATHFPKIKRSTVGMHVEAMCVNNSIRQHYPSIKRGSGHDLFFKIGPDRFRLWESHSDPAPFYRSSHPQEPSKSTSETTPKYTPPPDLSNLTPISAPLLTTQPSVVELLISRFPDFVGVFANDPPFRKYGQWEFHIETIARRKELGSVRAALGDDRFVELLYKTLQSWGIGQRASKLKPYGDFADTLRMHADKLAAFENDAIESGTLNSEAIGAKLCEIMRNMRITENDAYVVAGSKCLHHILPNVVVPIDRTYTQRFFGWQNPTFQYKQEACFAEAFSAFAEIGRRAYPGKFVDEQWNTSSTKVIDNAIIGFINARQSERGLTSANQTDGLPRSISDDLPFPLGQIAQWLRRIFRSS